MNPGSPKRRPYGTAFQIDGSPALKRWANIRCAYGAVSGARGQGTI